MGVCPRLWNFYPGVDPRVRFHVGGCPVCGSDQSFKERIYDKPKPKKKEDRYIQIPDQLTYDGCLEIISTIMYGK